MLKKFLTVAFGILFWLNFSQASAEIKIIEKVGSYTADLKLKETLEDITEHAREDARRQAAEEAGIFIKSSSVMINNNLTDKVEVIAATIMEILEEETFPQIEGKNITVICKIKAKIDTDKINPAQILGSQQQFEVISEKDAYIKQLEAENRKLREQAQNSASENQLQQIQSEFDKNQKQFLIAKYERDLNIFDFDTEINWQTVYEISQKLAELDALNPTAFRAAIYYFREQGDLKAAMDYCHRILKTKCPPDTAIEANTQLGDMYYNEFNDKANAKKFIDAGIALVKKTYSKAEIEKFVNGTNFELKDLELIGKTNTVRELYVLKSAIENILPKNISSESTIKEMELTDRVKVQYRIDW